MDFFNAELRSLKRYPKKESEKKSHNPVRCVKVSMTYFQREENKVEILTMKSKTNIL